MLIRLKQVNHLLPALENVLTSFGQRTAIGPDDEQPPKLPEQALLMKG
jgi:hypothetical protein